MAVLVGSQALRYYIHNLDRVTHDWDIWFSDADFEVFQKMHEKELVKKTEKHSIYEIDKEIFEVKSYSQLWETDKEIFDNTPAGPDNILLKWIGPINCRLYVASKADLYYMKLTTIPFVNEPKHQHDLALMFKHNILPGHADLDFINRRKKETQEHFEKEKKVKYDFFHKYHIPEYIVHDNLHVIIADLLDISIPTYQRITTAETDIAEELFNKLTHEQKISLMVEESLVLALERWFIPQMVENGINYKLVDNFYVNNEGFATYNILKHCCITGLKGEAEYIVNFSRANFFEIEKEWQAAKLKIKAKGGFPQSFFNELFDLRKKYRNGEKIGTV